MNTKKIVNNLVNEEVSSKGLVDEIKNRIKNITTNQLERLEHLIYVELAERDERFQQTMNNEDSSNE